MNMVSPHQVRTRLQLERLKRRLSQTDLAAKAGRLSASDISRFENGHQRPYPAVAKRLARVLKLEPDELLLPAQDDNEERRAG